MREQFQTSDFHLIYKTSMTPFFPICLMGRCYSGRFEMLIEGGLEPREGIALVSDGTVSWFFDRKLKESAEKIYGQILSNPKELDRLKRMESELSRKLLDEIETPIERLFSDGKLNEEGEKKFQRISKYYMDYGQVADVPGFFFQVYLTEKFRYELFTGLDKSEEEKGRIFNYLISTHKLTNYENFLTAISKSMKGEDSPERVAEQFYWVIHDYLGEIVDVKYVKNKMKEFEEDPSELNLHLDKAAERINAVEWIKKELPEDLLTKANIVQDIIYMYNERKKEVIGQTNIYLRKIVEYRFPGIALEQIKKIYQLVPEEISGLLKGEEIGDMDERNSRWGYVIKDGNISKAPEEYFTLIAQSEAKELHGDTASLGKVTGKVNVILNISHIYKFKTGDILVAPFTNINYVPIMAKAKAILTEVGGITSHAAIVSRELGVPCIVGIENLLLTLKDGDLVEVDADNGTVKKLQE